MSSFTSSSTSWISRTPEASSSSETVLLSWSPTSSSDLTLTWKLISSSKFSFSSRESSSWIFKTSSPTGICISLFLTSDSVLFKSLVLSFKSSLLVSMEESSWKSKILLMSSFTSSSTSWISRTPEASSSSECVLLSWSPTSSFDLTLTWKVISSNKFSFSTRESSSWLLKTSLLSLLLLSTMKILLLFKFIDSSFLLSLSFIPLILTIPFMSSIKSSILLPELSNTMSKLTLFWTVSISPTFSSLLNPFTSSIMFDSSVLFKIIS